MALPHCTARLISRHTSYKLAEKLCMHVTVAVDSTLHDDADIMYHLAVQSLHDSRRLETPVHKTMSIIMIMSTIGMDRV